MKKRFKTKIRFLAAIFILGLSLLSVFAYKQLYIKTLIVISPRDKINGLSIFNDQNLLNIQTEKIIQYLQRQNPSLNPISISKKFPDSLVVEAKSRMALAKFANTAQNMYIDQSGIIFESEENLSGLPVIVSAYLSKSANQKADWRVVKAIDFIQQANKQSINVDQIMLDDSAGMFSAILTDGINVLISYNADIQAKVSSLQLIIVRFRIEGKNISIVDFRFDKPIVILATGEKISSTF